MSPLQNEQHLHHSGLDLRISPKTWSVCSDTAHGPLTKLLVSQVDTIHGMFPDIPACVASSFSRIAKIIYRLRFACSDNIRYDLLRTGNIELTSNKILERGFLDAVRLLHRHQIYLPLTCSFLSPAPGRILHIISPHPSQPQQRERCTSFSQRNVAQSTAVPYITLQAPRPDRVHRKTDPGL